MCNQVNRRTAASSDAVLPTKAKDCLSPNISYNSSVMQRFNFSNDSTSLFFDHYNT